MKVTLLLLSVFFILVTIGHCVENACYHETNTHYPICTIYTQLSDQSHSPSPALKYTAIEIGYVRQPIILETLPWWLYYGAKGLVSNGELVIGSTVVYLHEPTPQDLMGNNAIYSNGRNIIVKMSNYHAWNNIVAKILHWIISDWQTIEKKEHPFMESFDYSWIHEICDKVGDGHIGGFIPAGADIILTYMNGNTLRLYVNDHLKYEKPMSPQQFARVAIYFKKSAFVSTRDTTLKHPVELGSRSKKE
jgi:hypothetical protein